MSERPPFWHPSTLIATCFGLGYAPKAPGTVGAGATALVLLGLVSWPPMRTHVWLGALIACPLVYTAGVWASRRFMSAVGAHDPGAIVVDEALGIMLAWVVSMAGPAIVPFGNGLVSGVWYMIARNRGWNLGHGDRLVATIEPAWMTSPMIILLGAFLLFRLFDVWKPGPVGRLDRDIDGPHGVMLDDVAAGVMAGLAWIVVTIAALIVWLALVWAQPDTGWQESHSHPSSTFQASQHN